MNNEQLYISIGVPAVFQVATLGVLLTYINSQNTALKDHFNAQLTALKETLRAELREMAAQLRLEIRDAGERRIEIRK